MYDYKVSIHNHLDKACHAFAQSHNIEQLAKTVGMRPATLRCKLNPDQPHQLTIPELLAIVDATEDPRILDGMLFRCAATGSYGRERCGNVPVSS